MKKKKKKKKTFDGLASIARAAAVLLQAIELRRLAHAGEQLLGVPRLGHILEYAGLVDAGDDILGVGIA